MRHALFSLVLLSGCALEDPSTETARVEPRGPSTVPTVGDDDLDPREPSSPTMPDAGCEEHDGGVEPPPPTCGDTAAELHAAAGATGIARDGDTLFFGANAEEWVDGTATIGSVSVGGGDAETLATGLSRVVDVQVDDAHVYFSTRYPFSIGRVARGGGAAEVVVGAGDEQVDFTLGATHVYYVTNTTGAGGTVHRVAKSGGAPELVVDLGELDGDPRGGLAVDDAWVYVTVGTDVVRAPRDGGPFDVVVSYPTAVYLGDLALDGAGALYVAVMFEMAAIARIDLAARTSTWQTTDAWRPWELGVYGDALLWAEGDGVGSTPLGGTGTTWLSLAAATDVAADDACAYFTSPPGIWSVAR